MSERYPKHILTLKSLLILQVVLVLFVFANSVNRDRHVVVGTGQWGIPLVFRTRTTSSFSLDEGNLQSRVQALLRFEPHEGIVYTDTYHYASLAIDCILALLVSFMVACAFDRLIFARFNRAIADQEGV